MNVRDPAVVSQVIFAAFVRRLGLDFPHARINALSEGTIDEDFAMLVTSHLFLGSSSTFSLWAGVACLGRAHIPQTLLFNSGHSGMLRRSPILDLAPALVIENSYAQQLVKSGKGMTLAEEMIRV